jgi:hopanoid-associated phosphorylase
VSSAGARHVVAVTGLHFEARIAAGIGVAPLAGGGDAPRIHAALVRALAQGATAFMSFGIAGGLSASAASGTWLVADAVIGRASRWPVDAAWAAALVRRLPGAVRGDLAGADAIVHGADAKRALGAATRALAVDMESHVVAAFAAEHGVPFAVFRVIADPAHRALAPAARVGMRHDGTIDRRAVLGSLLRRPGQIPLLLRNAADTRRALRALSRGRRLLGPGLGYPDFGELGVDMP